MPVLAQFVPQVSFTLRTHTSTLHTSVFTPGLLVVVREAGEGRLHRQRRCHCQGRLGQLHACRRGTYQLGNFVGYRVWGQQIKCCGVGCGAGSSKCSVINAVCGGSVWGQSAALPLSGHVWSAARMQQRSRNRAGQDNITTCAFKKVCWASCVVDSQRCLNQQGRLGQLLAHGKTWQAEVITHAPHTHFSTPLSPPTLSPHLQQRCQHQQLAHMGLHRQQRQHSTQRCQLLSIRQGADLKSNMSG